MTQRYYGLKRWQWIAVLLWVGLSVISMPPAGVANLIGRFVGAFVAAYLLIRVVSVIYGAVRHARQPE